MCAYQLSMNSWNPLETKVANTILFLSRLSAWPLTLWPCPLLAMAWAASQGLTLVLFSAQLEPCLTQETTLHTLNTPPNTPSTRATQSLRAPPMP